VASCGHNGAREKIALPAEFHRQNSRQPGFRSCRRIIIIYGTRCMRWKIARQPESGRDHGRTRRGRRHRFGGMRTRQADGLKVIACASSDEKLEFAKAHGASFGLNYATEDLKEGLRRLTKRQGVDIIFDPVGRYLCRGGAAFDRMGRSLSRDWIRRRRHSENAAQPRALERLRYPRRVLGRMDAAQCGEEPRQSGKTGEVDREGKISSHVDRTFPLAQTADALKVLAGRKAMGR